MRTHWLVFTTSLLSASILVSSAWAAHHEGKRGEKRGHHFERKDTDGDGSISKGEWMTSSEERFKQLDSDGDGVITQAEWDAGRERMRERWKKEKPSGGGY